MKIKTVVLDVECYRNYFLVLIRNVETGGQKAFELYDGITLDTKSLENVLTKYRIVTFNGRNYDIPIIELALTGATNKALKAASDNIIVENMKPWDFENFYELDFHRLNHIDLIEVAPGQASLKAYGGRLHSKKIQDLPVEPEEEITPAMREELRVYCGNDLATTIDLFNYLQPQLELREKMSAKFAVDLMSKSDAQIAEAVFKKRVEDITKNRLTKNMNRVGQTFFYKIPDFIFFKSPELNVVLDGLRSEPFVVGEGGSVDLPEWLSDLKIGVGDAQYRMGIGGLHSCEKEKKYVEDENTLLIDRDVTSYYPSIVLNQGLYPEIMGETFTKIYKQIVDARVKAKHTGDKVTADALKITINGSFGKFGSKWSYLYSPNLLIQTTITGQLALLMLIEMLNDRGISVVSANTDGIMILCGVDKKDDLDAAIAVWEWVTGFNTEDTPYSAVYIRDVNNYIAIKKDGSAKLKGAYAHAGLMKNPANEICVDAIVAYLAKGVPIETTIRECQDIRKFVTIRAVAGGGVKGDTFLGKAVRWYYAKGETGTINYKTNGNTVARSLGAKPLMILPETLPDDIDYDWYVAECRSILEDLSVLPRAAKPKKVRKNARDG